MIPGIDFDFNGRVLTIPPLTLGALQALRKRLAALRASGLNDPESIGTILDAAHTAIKRNYPEITRDEVGELVDLRNMGDVLVAVMDASGAFRREAALGETTPQPTIPTPAG